MVVSRALLTDNKKSGLWHECSRCCGADYHVAVKVIPKKKEEREGLVDYAPHLSDTDRKYSHAHRNVLSERKPANSNGIEKLKFQNGTTKASYFCDILKSNLRTKDRM